MKRINRLQHKIKEATSLINNSINTAEITHLAEAIIMEATEAQYATLWIHDKQKLRHYQEDATVEIPMNLKKGILYKTFATKKAEFYNHITSEQGYEPAIDNPFNLKLKSKIMLPLLDNETFLGIATAYTTVGSEKKFTKEDSNIFQAIQPFLNNVIYKITKNYTIREQDNNLCFINLQALKNPQQNTKTPQEILDYIANTVHDIRTPSNSLYGFLDILQEKIKDERLQTYINHAKESALLINDLTTSILESDSYNKESFTQEESSIHSIKFFADIAEFFSANISKKNIAYNIFLDPCLPKEISLTSIQLKRVLMNLISNAVKFTPTNGTVEFSVTYKEKENQLHIFVQDSGIGIAKEKQEKIFQAFTQAEKSIKNIYGGTGLGLAICSSYIQEMGGKLTVESELDKGSKFFFDLPLKQNPIPSNFKPIQNPSLYVTILMDKQKNSFTAKNIKKYLMKFGCSEQNIEFRDSLEKISTKSTHIVVFENQLSDKLLKYIQKNKKRLHALIVEENFLSLEKTDFLPSRLVSQYDYYGNELYSFFYTKEIPKILLVEDDAISITLLKAMLCDEDCEIDVAHNGEEGLELLKKALYKGAPYTIVYTDHRMSELTGTEMLQAYKTLEKKFSKERTKTVSISGETSDIDSNQIFDYSATKPFKKDEILSIYLEVVHGTKS